jgi:hypothetical protein
VRKLAVMMSRSGVPLRLIVFTLRVMMSRLVMMVGCGMVMRSR